MAINLKAVLTLKDNTRSGVKSATGNFNDLNDTVKGIAGAMGVAFGAKAIAGMIKTGAQAERIERRFIGLSGGVDQANIMLEAFKRGADGAVGDMSAMESAQKLLSMRLVENADEMEKVVELSKRLGDQTTSVKDRVADFSLMLANQSIMRLDNFGISSGRVREHIKELQQEFPKMTRETAFMNAAFEEGTEALERLGPSVDDNLSAFEGLDAKIENLSVTIGQSLAPMLIIGIDLLSQFFDVIGPALDKFNEMSQSVQDFGEMQEEAAKKSKEAFRGMSPENLASQWKIAGETFDEVNRDLAGGLTIISGMLPNSIDQYDLLENSMGAMNRAIIDQSGSWEDYLRIHDDVNAQSHDRLTTLPRLSEREVMYAINMRRSTSVVEEMRKAQEALNLKTLEATSVQGKAAQGAEDSEKRFRHLTRALKEGTIVIDEDAAALARLVYELGLQEVAAEEAAAAEEAQITKKKEMQARLEEMRIKREEAYAAEATAREEADARMVKSQSDLMLAVMDATEEQVKQKLLSMVDPNEVGLEVWAGLGKELGLLDDKAVAIATNLPTLKDAFTQNIVPTENMAALMGEFYKNAGNADFVLGPLIEKFAAAPELIDPVGKTLAEMVDPVKHLGEDFPVAAEGLGEWAGEAFEAVEPTATLWKTVHDLVFELEKATKEPWIITVQTNYGPGGSPTPTRVKNPDATTPDDPPEFEQMGGRVRGPIGSPQLIIAHGGEQVNNPFQIGAQGGPGGPPAVGATGGDSIVNNHFYNKETAAWWSDQQRRKRQRRFDQRVRGR